MGEIFTANNHSKWQINWKDVPKKTAEIAALALRQYFPTEKNLTIRQVDEFEVKSNNFRVLTSRGEFLLRRHIQHNADRGMINAIDNLIDFLASKGAHVVQSITAENGERSVSEGGSSWQLYRFIPGNHFRGTINELVEAGREIAVLHKMLRRFPSDDARFTRMAPLGPNSWNCAFPEIEDDDSPLVQLIADKSTMIAREVAEIAEHTAPAYRNAVSLLHNDLHPLNLIYEDGKLRAILDFGNMCVGPLCADVAYACHRLVRQFVVAQNTPWQTTLQEGAQTFLNSYLRENPFSSDEARCIPALMKEALLRKLCDVKPEYAQKVLDHDTSYAEATKFLMLLEETQHFAKALAGAC